MCRLLAESLNYYKDINASTYSIEVDEDFQAIAHTPQPQCTKQTKQTAVATSWDLIQHETNITNIPTHQLVPSSAPDIDAA
jgi:hypothetical protein